MQLYLIRHGESAGNVYAREAKEKGLDRVETPVRNADLPLSEQGRAEAFALCTNRSLRHFRPSAVGRQTYGLWSSPFTRALETADLAGFGTDLPLRVDVRLRERDLGVLDGLTTQGIKNLAPEESAIRERLGKFYHRPAGGESWVDVITRVQSFLHERKTLSGNTPQIIFAHDVVVLSALYICNRWTEQQMLDRQKNDPIQNASVITAYFND